MIIERWKNAQTYVIGNYHINNNLPCQDRTWYEQRNGVKVVALADGAGSQQNSEVGAELVCHETCNLLCECFIDFLMFFEYEKSNPTKHQTKMKELSKVIIDHLVYLLKDKALTMNVPLTSLSSTLLFFATKDDHYIYGHIGDGVIAGLYNENNGDTLKLLSESENGAASNITFFVPDSDASEHLRLGAGRLENLRGVILTSDGAADVLFSKKGIDDTAYELITKFNMKTTDEYNNILSEFLRKVISNYSTDDLSLNILCLEDNNTERIDQHYANYILSDIKSSKQIVRKSQYCYFLDSSIYIKEAEFSSPNEVKRYLKWN